MFYYIDYTELKMLYGILLRKLAKFRGEISQNYLKFVYSKRFIGITHLLNNSISSGRQLKQPDQRINWLGFFPLNQQHHTRLSFCKEILQISNWTHFNYIILNENRNHSQKKSSMFAIYFMSNQFIEVSIKKKKKKKINFHIFLKFRTECFDDHNR